MVIIIQDSFVKIEKHTISEKMDSVMVTVAYFILKGSKEPRSALNSRRVSLGAHWVDSRESSLLRRLERGREIGL